MKAEDEQYTYTFSKWDSGKKDGNVTTYTPEFKAEKKTEPVPKVSSLTVNPSPTHVWDGRRQKGLSTNWQTCYRTTLL